MRRFALLSFLIFVLGLRAAYAQNIVQLEYYVDTDPGFGSATQVAINHAATVDTTFSADLSAITDGFHWLYVRAKDDSSRWSLTTTWPFFKDSQALRPYPDVTAAEYYIDTDPGPGAGVAIPVTPDSLITPSFVANLTGVPDGFHRLYVRSKDATGRWSLTTAWPFFKDDHTLRPIPDVTAAEYYIDTDPGRGSGVAIPVTPDSLITPAFVANLNGINDGFHRLYVRSKDATGRWSLTTAWPFFKDNLALTPRPVLTAVEYTFSNERTSTGPFTVNSFTPTDSLALDFTANLLSLQSDTLWNINVTAVDANGRRSLPYTRAFTLDLPPLLALDDSASTLMDTPVSIPVLANDLVDGGQLAVVDVTQGAHGAVVIDPGDTTLTYTPVVGFSGQDTFTYRVTDGALLDSATVHLTVTLAATQLAVNPPALAFGTVALGTSRSLTLTLSNPGVGVLTISALDIVGPDAGQFAVTPATANIGPAGNQTVTVTFSASAAGSKTATLRLTHNASGTASPTSVGLSGNGQTPSLALGQAFGSPGDTVTVPLTLANLTQTAIGGLQLKVVLSNPSRAQFIGFSDSLSGLGFDAAISTLGDTTQILIYSTTNDSIPNGTRTLGTLTYQLSPTAPLGSENPLTLAIQQVGDPRAQAFQATASNGALLVGLRGDVNLDALIDVLDLIRLSRLVIGRDTTPIAGSTAFAIADVNRDGTLTVQDIVVQASALLGLDP